MSAVGPIDGLARSDRARSKIKISLLWVRVILNWSKARVMDPWVWKWFWAVTVCIGQSMWYAFGQAVVYQPIY